MLFRSTLSNIYYNLDGKRQEHQRVWIVPVTSLLRFTQAQQKLTANVTCDGNTIRITPWMDVVTNKTFPDPSYVSQDLHGQTFYVADSKSARLFVGPTEIRALQRNPADFTGRQSVTIVGQAGSLRRSAVVAEYLYDVQPSDHSVQTGPGACVPLRW